MSGPYIELKRMPDYERRQLPPKRDPDPPEPRPQLPPKPDPPPPPPAPKKSE